MKLTIRPSRLALGINLLLLVVLTTICVLSIQSKHPHTAKADLPCYGLGGSNTHAYSIGFSTCGTATGVYAVYTPLEKTGWHLDGAGQNVDHVNATVWLPDTNGTENYPEMGWWYGYMPGYTGIQQGNYIGWTINGLYHNTLVINYHGVFPDANKSMGFEIVRDNSSPSCYLYYRTGVYQATHCGFPTSTHMVQAGYEEQDSRLLNRTVVTSNSTPHGKFSNLEYHSTNNNWYYWGRHTHCVTNYYNGEHFTAAGYPFPTSFVAMLKGTGTYNACDGSAPVNERTSW